MAISSSTSYPSISYFSGPDFPEGIPDSRYIPNPQPFSSDCAFCKKPLLPTAFDSAVKDFGSNHYFSQAWHLSCCSEGTRISPAGVACEILKTFDILKDGKQLERIASAVKFLQYDFQVRRSDYPAFPSLTSFPSECGKCSKPLFPRTPPEEEFRFFQCSKSLKKIYHGPCGVSGKTLYAPLPLAFGVLVHPLAEMDASGAGIDYAKNILEVGLNWEKGSLKRKGAPSSDEPGAANKKLKRGDEGDCKEGVPPPSSGAAPSTSSSSSSSSSYSSLD